MMKDLFFEIDGPAFLISLGFALMIYGLFRRGKIFSSPSLFFSDLTGFHSTPKGWKLSLAKLPRYLEYASLVCFILAFIDPHLLLSRKGEGEKNPLDQTPTEGIAIYLLLDQSGSMSEEVTAISNRGYLERISKINLLKEMTKLFVEGDPKLKLSGRPNDLIGLIAFARAARVLSPLTLDHNVILTDISNLQVVKDRDQDGTSMGYAIYKTASIIAATKHFAEDLSKEGKPSYDIKNSIMILVTDGFQDPNPLDKGKRLRNIDLDEAAEYAKANGIRLYLINVDPSITSSEFAPQRRLLERITQLTGGKFYIVQEGNSLADVYADIDRIERSRLPDFGSRISAVPKDKQPQLYRRLSFYPFLIGSGMLLLLFSVILNTLVVRKVP